MWGEYVRALILLHKSHFLAVGLFESSHRHIYSNLGIYTVPDIHKTNFCLYFENIYIHDIQCTPEQVSEKDTLLW